MINRYTLCVFALLLLVSPIKVFGSNSKCYDHTAETIGDVGQYIIPALGVALTIKHDDWTGAKQFFWGASFSQLTSCALKYSFNVERPNHHDCSFPSGHTTMAFYGAGFMTRRYGKKFALPAFAAAFFVGYSRVEAKKHWVTDVLAGAAIGLFYNWVFTTPYKGRCCVYPCVTRDSYSIHCDYQL